MTTKLEDFGTGASEKDYFLVEPKDLKTVHDARGIGEGAFSIGSSGPWQPFDPGRRYACKILVAEVEEGGFLAQAAHLPGAVSQGETIEEAVQGIKEALVAILASYLETDPAEIPWADEEVEVFGSDLTAKWIDIDIRA